MASIRYSHMVTFINKDNERSFFAHTQNTLKMLWSIYSKWQKLLQISLFRAMIQQITDKTLVELGVVRA